MKPGALQQALQAHEQGDLAKAERGYRSLLAKDTRHVDALYLLGLLLHQSGRSGEAVPFLTRAIAVNGHRAEFHNTIGDAHRVLGATTPALEHFACALQLRAGHG